jgi:hypothetical protein
MRLRHRCAGSNGKVRENEAIAVYDLTSFKLKCRIEHRSRIYAGMKFAALTARVRISRKIPQQALVKLAPGKLCANLIPINTCDASTQTAGNHFAR